MADFSLPMIFDGHVDVLSKLHELKDMSPNDAFSNGYDAHIDLPKAKTGGFGGGFFAIYVPSQETPIAGIENKLTGTKYKLPLPPPLEQSFAFDIAHQQLVILRGLEACGALNICVSVEEIQTCLDNGKIAAIVHMEGADAIAQGFEGLELFHEAGLRSLGLVWSRPNIYADGVPFAFPSTGNTGPGLTDLGKELVRNCNRLKIMIDLSHLNEAGFWDVTSLSDAPLVATHSNAHVLSPCSRNLTDRQLDVIAETDGMVGLNFAVGFLRSDGQWNTDTGLEVMLAHLDHLLTRLGEDRVGIGSDFDGAQIPATIGDASALPKLREAFVRHGINADLMEKLCHKNWLRVLDKTWG